MEELLNKLYDQIKHGDEEHQVWLRNKIDEFIDLNKNEYTVFDKKGSELLNSLFKAVKDIKI